MSQVALEQRLIEFRGKQQKLEQAWRKTGNKPLLEFFVEIIPRALNAERCSIFVLDPKADNIWLQCGTGLKERQVAVPRSDSLVGQVISAGAAQIETEMDQRVGAHELVDVQTGFVTRNAICVPVHGVTVDGVTGAVEVLNKRGLNAKFTDEDRVVLEKLARLIQVNLDSIYTNQQMLSLLGELMKTIKLLEAKVKSLEKATT
jgi:signal transduction protein with GAF and PtsI domain